MRNPLINSRRRKLKQFLFRCWSFSLKFDPLSAPAGKLSSSKGKKMERRGRKLYSLACGPGSCRGCQLLLMREQLSTAGNSFGCSWVKEWLRLWQWQWLCSRRARSLTLWPVRVQRQKWNNTQAKKLFYASCRFVVASVSASQPQPLQSQVCASDVLTKLSAAMKTKTDAVHSENRLSCNWDVFSLIFVVILRAWTLLKPSSFW